MKRISIFFCLLFCVHFHPSTHIDSWRSFFHMLFTLLESILLQMRLDIVKNCLSISNIHVFNNVYWQIHKLIRKTPIGLLCIGRFIGCTDVRMNVRGYMFRIHKCMDCMYLYTLSMYAYTFSDCIMIKAIEIISSLR